MRHAFRSGIAIALFSAGVVAQSPPDFSGVWTPVESPNAAAAPVPAPGGPPPPPRTLSVTIVQSPTEMKVARKVDAGGREAVYNFVYKLDGSESVNQMGPLVFRTKAAWDGSTLVLSSVVSAAENPLGELKESYGLQEGDLIVEGSRRSPAGTFTSKTVHKRTPER